MENFRLATVSRVAPTAPTAAASVGEAMPAKMEPSTATMRNRGGNRALPTRAANWRGEMAASSALGMAGAHLGRSQEMIKM